MCVRNSDFETLANQWTVFICERLGTDSAGRANQSRATRPEQWEAPYLVPIG